MQTLTLLGQYDIWVRKGAIVISGATLHASSKIYRVYAPSTHSLPVIRSCRDPFGPEYQPVEITILTCCSRIRLLRNLSPKFGRIWNHIPSASIMAESNLDFLEKSYTFVSVTLMPRKNRIVWTQLNMTMISSNLQL